MVEPAPSTRVLVFGLGRSGEAVARHLRAKGADVVAVDDGVGGTARQRAEALGIELVERPDRAALAALVADAGLVVPSPGVAVGHPVFELAAAAGVAVRGEVELAASWATAPIVAVTGTNGKTTVTELVTAMLRESGRNAVAAGNIGLPLCDAVGLGADVVVAEVSSFQLWWTESFHPAVAVWLNVADDHLDWHPDRASYVAAKARIWARQDAGDTAVVNADDDTVMAAAAAARSNVVTFGTSGEADFTLDGGMLRGPMGDLVSVDELPRRLPHDVANGLAAAAAAQAAGATVEGVRRALRAFAAPPHRVSLVAERGGVRWYDDSKATNPHAALAAARSFESVVLLAGGRNKGLDLGVLAEAGPHLRAVVAFGEARGEVEAAFSGVVPVKLASSMHEAVRLAADLAETGDAVLLSPGCASFDAYSSYAERGDDFTREVLALDKAAGP